MAYGRTLDPGGGNMGVIRRHSQIPPKAAANRAAGIVRLERKAWGRSSVDNTAGNIPTTQKTNNQRCRTSASPTPNKHRMATGQNNIGCPDRLCRQFSSPATPYMPNVLAMLESNS